MPSDTQSLIGLLLSTGALRRVNGAQRLHTGIEAFPKKGSSDSDATAMQQWVDDMTDVTVIGGGVIGLATAAELSRAHISVRVIDRGHSGGRATRAAAGILSPTDAHEWEDTLGEFNAKAIAAWPAFAAALEDDSGSYSGFERRGEIRVARDRSASLEAAVEGAQRLGLSYEVLSEAALVELEPGLSRGWRAVALSETAAVETDALTTALERACRNLGGVVLCGTEVAEIVVDREKASGVRLTDGQVFLSEAVVVCAGAWSSSIGGIDPPLASTLRPLLGESLIIESPGAPLPTRIIRTARGSLVPRADGRYWLGTTATDRGFQALPGVGAIKDIITNGTRYVPAIADALLIEARSGLRPVSSDGLPIVGPTRIRGLVYATGHGRQGIMHAPLTAQLLRAGFEHGAWEGIPPTFSPGRLEQPRQDLGRQ